MKIVTFAGALRRNSIGKHLIHQAAGILHHEHGVTARFLDLRDYPFPVYDADIEESSGIPPSILALGKEIAAADALVIAAPEYNGGISSVLKTLIDWLSRLKPMPLTGKFLLLVGASPSGSGGIAGLWHTRVPFEALGVHVFPYMVAVPRSGDAFNGDGKLVDEKARRKLQEVLESFIIHVGRHHPIVRETPQKVDRA